MIRLWMATLLLAVPATAQPTLVFGRLEHRPSHCRIVVDGRPLDCTRLQISANGSGGLRLRFIGDDDKTGGSYQLSFVCLDGDQGSPLSCDNSDCRLDSRRSATRSARHRSGMPGDSPGLPATAPPGAAD